MQLRTIKTHTYYWQGISAQGKKTSGETIAASINLAKMHLQQQNIHLIKIQKKSKLIFDIRNKKLTEIDIAIFFRQLATLLSAGIPIVQSCEILRGGQEKKSLQKLISAIKHDLEAGKNLNDSLQKNPRYFKELICQLVYTGEQTGTLATMLNQIAHYQEKLLALKKQIKQALFYPCLTLLVALIITIIMLTCIVPRFQELFAQAHEKLPALTRGVIFVSESIREHAWNIGIVILAFFLTIHWFKQTYQFKQFIDKFILKLPLLAPSIKKIILTRFARNLATTFSAGIPITDSLNIIAKTVGNNIYEKAIIKLQMDITTGQQLHLAMQNNSSLFSPMIIQMVKVGEESGTLDHMLEKMAVFYESQVDHLVAHLNRLAEPLIMVILGVLIGALVIAMYLPIFKLGTVI